MKLLLCLLPVIVQARITIDIHASDAMRESDMTITGFSYNTISRNDIKAFQLSAVALKQGVYELTGKKKQPTDVYIRTPTPWNLYQTYKWKQVTTLMKATKTKIINIVTEEVILNQKEVKAGSETTQHKVALPTRIENKLSSHWDNNTKPFIANIDYNINFEGIGNMTRFNVSSKWNTNLSQSNIAIVNPSVVEFRLEPNQKSRVTLTATKVTINVQIEYMAILSGVVVANFEEGWNGHHFYAYDVASVVEASGVLSDRLITHESIFLEFYVDSVVIVDDVK